MKHLRRAGRRLPALLLALVALTAAAAQAEPAGLEIVEVDASGYPEITLAVRGTDAEGLGLADLSGVRLEEDGESVDDFTVDSGRGGMRVLFVLDANETFAQRDEQGGLSRREKVRDSLLRFANLFMDPTQEDMAGVVVPDGEGGRFLDRPNLRLPADLIGAANGYDPGELGPTPLNAMLTLALEHAARDPAGGRYQAIVLLTDGAAIGDQLDFERLVARVQQAGVTFYGLVLGSRADPAEVANVTRLTEPTLGRWLHMPEPTAADDLYAAIRDRATVHTITYRSNLTGSGTHRVAVALGGARAEAAIDLRVEPPAVSLTVDNSRPIRRLAPEAGTPLEEMEPTAQPLVAQVTWPDGLPRSLAAAALLVDGREETLTAPVLDDSGRLTFDWDISRLDAGTYEVQVKVTDVLALEGVSEPLALAIEIERPEAPAAATAPPTPATAPQAAEPPGLIAGIPNRLLAIGGAALGVVLLLLFAAVLVKRRRRRPPAAAPDPELARLASPAVQTAPLYAYLEAVENAPEHRGPIPIPGANVPLGRDSRQAQVCLNDSSVSRLHARIIATGGVYRIHDEGSASGTYVNFERVGLAPRLLKDNDDIHLGRVRLRFHITSPDDRAGPAEADAAGEPADDAETQI